MPHTGPTSASRFAIVFPSSIGPEVEFYFHHDIVIDMLARYCNGRCGTGVSVWYRSFSDARWIPITAN